MLKKFLNATLYSILFIFLPALAFAAKAATATNNNNDASKFYAIAAGFGIAIAAFGGALGQSKAIAAALEGISRNPGASGKIQTPMIIGLALIESLVIYAFVIAFMILGKM